jgi:hypothetical protein
MIIYRFEKNGLGPYINRSTTLLRDNRKTRTSRKYNALLEQKMKSIDSEARFKNYMKAHEDKRYMYGCKSKEDLRMYFSGDFKSLFAQGFRIKRYKVPDEEVIDMAIEVAFPVRYHKLQKVSKIQKLRA